MTTLPVSLSKKVPPPSRKSVVSAVGTPRDTPEGTPQPGSSDVINQYEWVHNPLPFKNPGYAAIKAKHSRTKKTAKQILAMEQTRGMNLPGMDGGEGSGTATPEKVKRPRGANLIGRGKRKKMEEESVTPSEAEGDVDMDKKQAETPAVLDPSIPPKREVISYLTSQAPPSLLPAKKYCDITGLPAKYTDPKTRLHFRGLEVLDVIRGMGPGQEQLYLALRGAQQTLM